VTRFINALCSLAGNCDFGTLLEERLRDQLLIGINNDAWQKEVFRLHSTIASTLVQVEATALVLEQASVGYNNSDFIAYLRFLAPAQT